MKQLSTYLLILAITVSSSLAVSEKLGPGWTPKGKIPEKYDRLVSCAERNNAICQTWLGDIWNGSDYFTIRPDGFDASEIFNPPEAERWYRAAAIQGYHPAMDSYGRQLCLSANFTLNGATKERTIEGLAWVIASERHEEKKIKNDGTYSCWDFRDAIETKSLDKEATLAIARKRANEIKSEIEENSGFRFGIMDPCTPFLWFDDGNPYFGLFRVCLNLRLKDFLEFLMK
jgi:hypothetical protein